jgi:hypothetical protein
MAGESVRIWGATVLLLFAAGCASTVPLPVFQPKDKAGVQSFFRNGAAIGAIEGDSMFALIQVEPVRVGEYSYARLWLLVQNQSSKPLLVEPMKCASLRIESIVTRERYGRTISPKPLNITPSSPTSILAKITNDQATSSILSTVGAVLQAAATQPTTATTSGRTANGPGYSSTTTINDVGEKRQTIIDRRMAAMASTNDWYESFKSSVNQGILRRNTLFPGEGVNGYIYFKTGSAQPRPSERRYIVTLTTAQGEKVAVFEPIEGE